MDNTKPYTKAATPEEGRGCTFHYSPEGHEAIPCEGCFKLHETAWMEEYPTHTPTDIFEVRFKNTRRSYYQNANNLPLKRGDIVAVEASPGHDIGIISLTGDMVAKQMRRVGFNPLNSEFKKIYRKAKPYDIERWQEAIVLEHETMIAARQIAADMNLNMKIGDVEYQGDKIKAIFYYIADERVDFRELIKVFAEQFHIRIEMKQIGARQEAGRIGGIGACGRELCCASWISSFSSVTTNSARMQEISLNPQKLAGQCSKLKCCLVYEYDTYVDARKEFPRMREPLQALDGEYHLVKNDILAGTMIFSSSKDAMINVVTLPIARVKEIIALNRAGKKVEQLRAEQPQQEQVAEPTYHSEEDSITRFDSAAKGRNRRRNGSGKERENRNENNSATTSGNTENSVAGEQKSTDANAQTEERRNQRGDRRGGDRNRSGEQRGERSGQSERRADRPGQENRPAQDTVNAGADATAENKPNRPDESRTGNARRNRSRGRGRRDGNRSEASQAGTPRPEGAPADSSQPNRNRGENNRGDGTRNRRDGNRSEASQTGTPRPEGAPADSSRSNRNRGRNNRGDATRNRTERSEQPESPKKE